MTPPNLSLFLIMICFWLTMWLVSRYLIRPVGRVLTERQRRIDDAEVGWNATHGDYLKATAEVERQLEEAAREAQRVRGEHRQRALGGRQRMLDSARQRADQRLEQALSELDSEAAATRDELRERAAELARLFASRLLKREVAS